MQIYLYDAAKQFNMLMIKGLIILLTRYMLYSAGLGKSLCRISDSSMKFCNDSIIAAILSRTRCINTQHTLVTMINMDVSQCTNKIDTLSLSLCNSRNSLSSVGYGYDFKCMNYKLNCGLISQVFKKTILMNKCQRISLVVSQHWFRW